MMNRLKRSLVILIAIALVFAMVLPTFAAVDDTSFADVDADAWYAEAVAYCQENRLMGGTGNIEFSPQDAMTRAMLVTVLYRLDGSPAVTGLDTFNDTAEDAWYTNAILWASQENIVGGYGNNLFGTNDPITREQLAAILWRYAGSPRVEAAQAFADQDTIAAYAAEAVDWARSNGYIGGKENNQFAPGDQATRAEVAAILMRFTKETQTQPAPEPAEDKRVLVAYFSATGNTEGVAQNLVNTLGADVADLYEITPAQRYTAADLDYTNSGCRSVREQQDSGARPAISGAVENMEQYDIIFLGYPIWNNDAPRIIYTFLENENLSGRTIVPFCTSGSSGIGNSVSNISGLAGDAAWLNGQRFSAGASEASLESWIADLHLELAAG